MTEPMLLEGIRVVEAAIQVDGAEKRAATCAPEIGEQGMKILKGRGYEAGRIEVLLATGAVRAG